MCCAYVKDAVELHEVLISLREWLQQRPELVLHEEALHERQIRR